MEFADLIPVLAVIRRYFEVAAVEIQFGKIVDSELDHGVFRQVAEIETGRIQVGVFKLL